MLSTLNINQQIKEAEKKVGKKFTSITIYKKQILEDGAEMIITDITFENNNNK